MEEYERDMMYAEDAAERRKKIPQISVDSDQMHVTVDGDDGKPNTVTLALAIMSDGTWSTQTSPRRKMASPTKTGQPSTQTVASSGIAS